MEQLSQQTALLVMDMQSVIANMVPDSSAALKHTAAAIAYARKKNIPVIYVVVGFRRGMPEISANNKGFSASKERMANADMLEWVKIHPDVAPLPNEIITTKRRISAFAGSDLEVILRAFSIQHLVLTGFSTSGVVLSTLREAADKDYRLTVLSDCCGDGDEEVHRVLVTKVFPRQADILTTGEWVKL
ncbi:MAG: cysteine hydrolase [Bacteroidetes bacterium]|nr:cysteine hydrolase [Bacteroidota bacterium]